MQTHTGDQIRYWRMATYLSDVRLDAFFIMFAV